MLYEIRAYQVMPFVTAGLVFVLLLMLLKGKSDRQVVIFKYRELSGFLRGKNKGNNWYGNEERWLLSHGGDFHYGEFCTPIVMLSIQILFMGIGGIMGFILWGSMGALGLGGALFFLPKGLLLYLNEKDNEKMISDLKTLYHAMEIQIGAGVYVTDALAECYGFVKERRLRQALLDLAGDIVMKADIYESLESFQKKFSNSYIDALCITLLQALESGQALELLRDLAEQIRDLELNVLRHKKNALDRSITFYQLGILASVLGVVLYACITQMFQATLHF